MRQVPERGDILTKALGAEVIRSAVTRANDVYVLAKTDGDYVTWYYSPDGYCSGGHYWPRGYGADDDALRAEAMADLFKRAGIVG